MAESDRPDLNNATDWAVLLEAMRLRAEQVEGKGNPLAARDMLRTAISGLRTLLDDRPLDPEQRFCVRWLERRLSRVNLDHRRPNADKALGLVVAHAPPVPEERDMLLCLWAHQELGKPRYRSMAPSKARAAAFAEVAKRATKRAADHKPVTVRQVMDAWKKYAAPKRGKRGRSDGRPDK